MYSSSNLYIDLFCEEIKREILKVNPEDYGSLILLEEIKRNSTNVLLILIITKMDLDRLNSKLNNRKI